MLIFFLSFFPLSLLKHKQQLFPFNIHFNFAVYQNSNWHIIALKHICHTKSHCSGVWRHYGAMEITTLMVTKIYQKETFTDQNSSKPPFSDIPIKKGHLWKHCFYISFKSHLVFCNSPSKMFRKSSNLCIVLILSFFPSLKVTKFQSHWNSIILTNP